jgi:hypothetical protein
MSSPIGPYEEKLLQGPNPFASIDPVIKAFEKKHQLNLIQGAKDTLIRMFHVSENKIRIYEPSEDGTIKVEVFGNVTGEFSANKENLSWILEKALKLTRK